MHTETRYYVIDTMETEFDYIKATNDEFMEEAENNGRIYLHEGFMKAFNDGEINTEIDQLRIIEVPLHDASEKEIQDAKKLLENTGYFTDNLWTKYDVMDKVNEEITNEQAQEILRLSLTNEATMEQIQFSIKEFAELEGLTLKED